MKLERICPTCRASIAYTPDFVVDQNRLIECKPKKLWNTPTVQSKVKAAEKYCLDRDYTFEMVEPIRLSIENIHELWKEGQIKFVERTEAKFLAFYEVAKPADNIIR